MRTTRTLRTVCVVAIALVLAAAGSIELKAQRFQNVYGTQTCVEAGYSGVVQLAGGGYAAAGESQAGPNFVCGASHIYVIYTNPNGGVIWANVYQIGLTSDSALDIVECANGDLAICGVTTDAFGCNHGRDAFLLRLNPTGGIMAVQTYGTDVSDEIAWNLVEATSGDGITTRAGDFIVVGSTTYHAGNAAAGVIARDGYIFRTGAFLNLIWGRHYGGPNSQDDYLYGVDECRFGNVPCADAGDIVATGGTNTWGAGGYDIWELRVDGNDGTIGAAPQNAAVYGGPSDDEGRAIIELQVWNTPGDLVVTGISFSRPFPSTNSEVAMLQTGPDPCVFIADHYAGDNGPHPDGGLDLKEDAFPTIATGDVIVTGFTDWGGFVGTIPPNAFLQKFVCGTMAAIGVGMAYGGNTTDWGWSVNNCTRVSANETQGYVVAGFTQSPSLIGADPQQLYLIKTDLAFSSGCNEIAFGFLVQPAGFFSSCPTPYNRRLMCTCRPNFTQWPLPFWKALCYFLPRAQDGGGNGNDGAVSDAGTKVTIEFTEGRVSSYPNPITRGVPLNLEFTFANPVHAVVSVTDVSGRIMYNERLVIDAGTKLTTIPTKGWASGSYVVRVAIGEKSLTTKVVLAD